MLPRCVGGQPSSGGFKSPPNLFTARADTRKGGAADMDEVTMVVSVVGLVIASITLGFKIAKEIYHRK